MRKKETPNPSRVRGRGVEVSETLFHILYQRGEYVFNYMENLKDKNESGVLYAGRLWECNIS